MGRKERQKEGAGRVSRVFSRKDVGGLFICFLLFVSGFAIHGNIGLYFNIAGFLIVSGGALVATLISFRVRKLAIVFRVLAGSYRTRVKQPDEIVEILVDLSVKSRLQGLLALEGDEEGTTVVFLRQALGFLVDGYGASEIRDYLSAEMYFFKKRREEIEQVLITIGEFCPSFGLVGSVVGLISMLSGVGDTSVILATIPVALTSTLYGIILANFLFFPFAANIRERTAQELLLKKIIMEGAIAIRSELHPRLLERKLKSFLTPAARRGKLVSFKRIQEMFEVEKQNRAREKESEVTGEET